MFDLMLITADPNAHILWLENVDARVKALRDIEAGSFFHLLFLWSKLSLENETKMWIINNLFGSLRS